MISFVVPDPRPAAAPFATVPASACTCLVIALILSAIGFDSRARLWLVVARDADAFLGAPPFFDDERDPVLRGLAVVGT